MSDCYFYRRFTNGFVVAHRLMKRVKGTPYFGVVAFVYSAIAHPILFWFVFGTFSGDVSSFPNGG